RAMAPHPCDFLADVALHTAAGRRVELGEVANFQGGGATLGQIVPNGKPRRPRSYNYRAQANFAVRRVSRTSKRSRPMRRKEWESSQRLKAQRLASLALISRCQAPPRSLSIPSNLPQSARGPRAFQPH